MINQMNRGVLATRVLNRNSPARQMMLLGGYFDHVHIIIYIILYKLPFLSNPFHASCPDADADPVISCAPAFPAKSYARQSCESIDANGCPVSAWCGFHENSVLIMPQKGITT